MGRTQEQDDDEYQLQPEGRLPSMKPLKAVYEQVRQQRSKQIRKRQRPRTHTKPIQSKPHSTTTDEAFKYVKNQALETELKSKALRGVLRIINLMAKSQTDPDKDE